MNAWPTEGGDAMGPSVTRAVSAISGSPPLKNGGDLRETGYLIAVGSRTARFRRKHRKKLFWIIIIVLLILAILNLALLIYLIHRSKKHPIEICKTKECLRSAANLALSIDDTANPCNNFYQYSCGKWAEAHPRPDAFRSYDWFRDKQTKVYTAVRDFFATKEALNITNYPKPVQQAKDMYTACMDVETLDKRGVKPVVDILMELGLPVYPTLINITNDIDYTNYTFDWIDAVIKVKTKLGMDVLIGFDIFADTKNSSIFRLSMGSPETTNPFPSMHNRKKRYRRRKLLNHFNSFVSSKYSAQTKFIFNDEKYFERKVNVKSEEDDEKIDEMYKIFFARLMKIFVLKSEDFKNINITETELDSKLLEISNTYYDFDEFIYNIKKVNETDIDEEEYLDLPELTVDELQRSTDEIVELNNGTSTPIWKRYLEGVFNITDIELDFENDKLLLAEPDMKYLALLATYVSRVSPAAIELYIWTKVVDVLAIHTTSELRSVYDKLYVDLGEAYNTAESSPSRSLRCASAVDDMLGMAVAFVLADPNFTKETKPKEKLASVQTVLHLMLSDPVALGHTQYPKSCVYVASLENWIKLVKIQIMLKELKNALAHLIGRTKWMDDNTKLETYRKIIEMKTLIGFPDWLLNKGQLEMFYKGIQVNSENHLENMINVIRVKIRKALNGYRKVHDSASWSTNPTEVNAYHTFQKNTITVPMVILQYPFYSLGLESLNYGSVGTILGHEITHGFDNYGRLFDKNGNFIPWWTNQTIELYVNMTKCFIEQYSKFYVKELDDYVNGKNTLGENIADNGGVREALVALRHHLRKYGPEPKLPGFEHLTSEQLFFLSYGNLWCGVSTKDALKADLEDEHSPQIFRAIGSLQNMEDFAKAWKCPSGSKMNPSNRCVIF